MQLMIKNKSPKLENCIITIYENSPFVFNYRILVCTTNQGVIEYHESRCFSSGCGEFDNQWGIDNFKCGN